MSCLVRVSGVNKLYQSNAFKLHTYVTSLLVLEFTVISFVSRDVTSNFAPWPCSLWGVTPPADKILEMLHSTEYGV